MGRYQFKLGVVLLLASNFVACGPESRGVVPYDEMTGGNKHTLLETPTPQPRPSPGPTSTPFPPGQIPTPTPIRSSPTPPIGTPSPTPTPPFDDCRGSQYIPRIFDNGPCNQTVGFYSTDGKLTSDNFMPLEGEGYVKLFRPRNRLFATTDMIQVLVYAGENLRKLYPSSERMQIGDISQRGGGEISGHASHRNGLDADIVFLRNNHKEQDPNFLDGFIETFVFKGEVTNNFDVKRNWDLFKVFVSTKRVRRIFVDVAVKMKLCSYVLNFEGLTPLAEETLRRLRPLEGHDDHFHIRLTCPKRSPKCDDQEEVPEGPGCGLD